MSRLHRVPEPIAATAAERAILAEVERALTEPEAKNECSIKLVGPNGQDIELPASASCLLREVVHYLAQGDAVGLLSIHEELTPQAAANLLNVPESYLDKLLAEGRIPYTQSDADVRIKRNDLLAYKEQRDDERKNALSQLTQLSQKLGLYGR